MVKGYRILHAAGIADAWATAPWLSEDRGLRSPLPTLRLIIDGELKRNEPGLAGKLGNGAWPFDLCTVVRAVVYVSAFPVAWKTR